jgi:hypothetical protein
MKSRPIDKRAAPPAERAQPTGWRQLVPNPPKRRRWLLILSAAGVALWTLFLAWMAWVS